MHVTTVGVVVCASERKHDGYTRSKDGKTVPPGVFRSLWLSSGLDQEPKEVRVPDDDHRALLAFETILSMDWLSNLQLVCDLTKNGALILVDFAPAGHLEVA